MKERKTFSGRAIRQAGICASWLVWVAGWIWLMLGNASRGWTPVWLLLGFAPYLLALNVLEPWLRKRGLLRKDEDAQPLA